MKKKLVFVFLLLALACIPLVAGGSGESTSSGKTNMLLWLPPNSKGDVLDIDFWTDNLAPWAEENNVNLEIEIIPWSEYEAKYLTGFSSGEGPDVGYMYLEMMNDYIEMGLLEDLDPYFSEEEKAHYNYYAQGYINGGQYAMPFVVGNQRIIFFNMDILAEAGVRELPTTWAEFVDVLLTVKKNVPNVIPLAQPWGDATIGALNSLFYPFFWQAGGEMYIDGEFAFDEGDAALKTIQFLHDLKFVYGVVPDDLTAWTESTAITQFAAGNVACVATSISAAKNNFSAINYDYVISLKDERQAVWTACDSLIMNADGKNKELAASLIKYMTSYSVMERYHREVTAYPPLTVDEPYQDDPRFLPVYEATDIFHTMPVADGASNVGERLYKNLQLMMMGNLSVEDVISDTVAYAKSLS